MALFPYLGSRNNRRSFIAEPDGEIVHVTLSRDPHRGFGKRAPGRGVPVSLSGQKGGVYHLPFRLSYSLFLPVLFQFAFFQ